MYVKSGLNRMWRNGWRVWHLVVAIILMALGFVITREAWLDLLSIALKDEESSHLLIVPLVAAWLAFVRRSRLRFLSPIGGWIGPSIVILSWFLYASGDTYLIQTFWYLGAIGIPVGCLLSVAGKDFLLRLFPAFAVLAFLIPIPGSVKPYIAGPLQTTTAVCVEWFFGLFGTFVTRSGNLLVVNGEPITIAEACNGLRMVFALVLVSFAFAFSSPMRTYVRVLLILASPVLAITCNILRLVPTLWTYGHLPRQVGDSLHNLGGWITLFVAMLLLFGILRLIRWTRLPIMIYSRVLD